MPTSGANGFRKELRNKVKDKIKTTGLFYRLVSGKRCHEGISRRAAAGNAL
jgi:hypothetical protein